MSPLCASLDRLAPTRRPAEPAVGFQRWSDLLFVHWSVDADVIRRLLPETLTLDTWNGDAMIGLVPFRMSGIRPWWFPAIPGLSAFCETNVRTYVYSQDGSPGVWFFSLDAAQSLAVHIARRRWNLPYHRADMEVRREGWQISYVSRRRSSAAPAAACNISARIGEPWPVPSSDGTAFLPGTAVPGTLDHFLLERSILYAQSSGGTLLRAHVHHRPYPLRQVEELQLEQTLLEAVGIPTGGDFVHAAFSEGVDVDIFPLRPVE
jgi:uncharacterized protein YqjF (DUF2071 family)